MQFKSVLFTLLFLVNNVLAEPLKIGVLVPLTGYVSDYGIAFKNGMELAISEKDSSGVNKIRLTFEDSAYDAKLSLSAFNKLITTDNADIIFSWGSTPSAVIGPLAKQRKIPVFTFTGVPEISANNDYVVDFTNRLEDNATATLNYLRSKGYKKFGIVKTEIHYLEALTESIKLKLSKDESLKIIDSFQPGTDINFHSSLIKIKQLQKQNEIEALGVLLTTGQISNFYQKMAQFKIDIPKFGSDFMLQKDEMKKSGGAVVGTIFSTRDVNEDFSNKYLAKYKSDQQISFAAQGYDITNLLFYSFKGGFDIKDAAEIFSQIENVKSLPGVLGEATFIKEDPSKFKDPGKRFNFPIIIKEVRADGTTAKIQ